MRTWVNRLLQNEQAGLLLALILLCVVLSFLSPVFFQLVDPKKHDNSATWLEFPHAWSLRHHACFWACKYPNIQDMGGARCPLVRTYYIWITGRRKGD